MPPLFPDRLEDAWRRLVTLNAERAEREQSIRETFEAARVRAERDYRKAIEAAEDRYETRRARLEEEYASVSGQITGRFTAAMERAQRTREVELELIEHKAEHGDAEARKQLDEAIWLAESVFEAGEDHPRTRFEGDTKALLGKHDELESIARDAAAWLRRCHMPPLPEPPDVPPPFEPATPDDEQMGMDAADPSAAMDEPTDAARAAFETLRGRRLPRLFPGVRTPTLALLAAGAAAAAVAWQDQWQLSSRVGWAALAAGAATLFVLAVLYVVARRGLTASTRNLAVALAEGRAAHAVGGVQAELNRAAWAHRLVTERDRDMSEAQEKFGPIIAEITGRKQRHIDRIKETYDTLVAEQGAERDAKLAEIEARTATRRERIESHIAAARTQAETRRDETLAAAAAARDHDWNALLDLWNTGATEAAAVLDEAKGVSEACFHEWDDPVWTGWTPPTTFAPAARFGVLDIDMEQLDGGPPQDEQLVTPWPKTFTLPAALGFPNDCSLILEHNADGGDAAVSLLQLVMFRLLTVMPPGKVRFTIIDPVGLGQNFAGFMHLTDHLETLVTDRIWTETRHIEQRLADLTDHMENVIQKYLRQEYETIAEYNAQAGEIAEPCRFLVIANFPVNFSENAARRLASIASSGARCGVFILAARDVRQPMPKGLEIGDLQRYCQHMEWSNGSWLWRNLAFGGLPLRPDEPPTSEFMIPRLRLVGTAAKDSSRVEVPFAAVAPPDGERWSRSTASDLCVPLGRCGATSLQELELGHGTSQHVLIAGKTGSGKSTLLHVLITNLALWYSPDEVEMYLVDFKKGVEFKAYAAAKLPHARAVAIESDREFGLSVLQRLDRELKRRGDLFRSNSVQDLAGYRAATGAKLPRTLLIIDEFQELFVEDDKIAQDAALLLDRLVRQGRAFGIHVILGSQTLGGAYSLAKSTMGQMAVRIALQCSETDSYLIMSEDNAGARLLSRPGEAIYNDASGLLEGNSPFQIVWLPEATRDPMLREVAERAEREGWRSPEPLIVFEGSAAAEVSGNRPLADLLDGHAAPAGPPRLWLGEAVAIKDPTAASFVRQSGSNLLIVGQRDEAAAAMFSVGLVVLGAGGAGQSPETGDCPRCGVVDILDGTPPDSPLTGYLQTTAASLPVDARFIERRALVERLQAVTEEIDRRAAGADAPPRFLFVFGLQRFRDLRQSDSFGFSFSDDDGEKPPSADKLFQRILTDGPTHGVHTIIWCDTAANLERCFDRQLMREFDMRVVFQMSATDSTNLIDSPRANKLGLRHAIFYSEEQGAEEKFRPYGLPEEEWVAEAARKLRNVETSKRRNVEMP